MIFTCSQSTIRLANGGLNCQVCCNDKPSMSKMTWAPAIWVADSIMAASRNITAPLYTSSNVHFLCFHLSKEQKQIRQSKIETYYDIMQIFRDLFVSSFSLYTMNRLKIITRQIYQRIYINHERMSIL